MARMGTPWCQLPAEYGQWNSVYRRWAAWCDRGVWSRLMASLQTDADLSAGLLDSTVVRAHVSAAGAPKNQETDPAFGRSRGGFSTQIHILADRRGRPLRLRVTGGPVPRQHPGPGPGGSLAWLPATTNMPIATWVFCTWPGPGSG